MQANIRTTTYDALSSLGETGYEIRARHVREEQEAEGEGREGQRASERSRARSSSQSVQSGPITF